jgi:hypothetical protein
MDVSDAMENIKGDFFVNAANHSPCLSLSKLDLLNSFNEAKCRSAISITLQWPPLFLYEIQSVGGGISNDHITVSPRLFVDTVIKRHL